MEQEIETRDFADVITELRGGVLHHELSQEMRKVAADVHKYGRMGQVVLTLKFKAQGANQVSIEDDLKVKLPKPDRQPTLMFNDEDGFLSRDHRRQMKLSEVQEKEEAQEPKEVEEPAKGKVQLKEVNSGR